MNWQPIETAPRDREILAVITGPADSRDWFDDTDTLPFVMAVEWFPNWYGDLGKCGWIKAGFDEEYGGLLVATHWMPLPEPPQSLSANASADSL